MIFSSDTDNHIKNNAPDGTSVEGTTGVEVSESDGESTASDSAKIQPTSEPQKAAPSLESKQTPNYGNSLNFNAMSSLTIVAALAHNPQPSMNNMHCKAY